MTAERIARALGGRKTGACWMARCPVHGDHDPSLSIREDRGKVLVRCHAGCEQRDVIAELARRGLWNRRSALQTCGKPGIAWPRSGPYHRDDNRTNTALSIWHTCVGARDTLVESYLAGRGLSMQLQPSIRFHPGLRHPSGGRWPCMVALVTLGVGEKPIAIHRTYLARAGGGKAPVDPTKMMLGPCRGGVVRLGVPGDVLMVGEGIETCLAAMQATGKSAWAALSTSGLRALDLPRAVREVIVLADGDAPGEAAARQCARRWQREGRRVRIARPPRGMDFNDLLNASTPVLSEGGQ